MNTVHPLNVACIFGGVAEMGVVTEPMVSKEVMVIVRGEVLEIVRPV